MIRRVLFGLVALCLAAGQAFAEERIRDFRSGISVNPDSTIEVTETIAVDAEGIVIRHGIYRDIPTVYTSANGFRTRVDIDVLSVRRDGDAEPFARQSLNNGIRIKIGSADVFVAPGTHIYEIKYRAARVLGFFDDFDELYWNVTGNDWDFPIDKASVSIELPAGAEIKKSAAYTGRQGEQGRDFNIEASEGRAFKASTTSPLFPGEGFTVALAWQKGIVTPPSDSQQLRWWMRDNVSFFALGLGLLGVLGYFYSAWSRVGRDPPKGTIIPLFAPPNQLGPAAIRYLFNKSFDDRSFAAGLVGLAVKGKLKISEDGGDFSITKADAGAAGLTPSEAAFNAALPSGTTELQQENHSRLGIAKSRLESALEGEYEGSVFQRNYGWFVVGAVISCVSLIASALLMPNGEGIGGLFVAGWASIWWGVILAVGWNLMKGIWSGGPFQKVAAIVPLVFGIPFVIAGIGAPAAIVANWGISPHLIVIIGAALVFAAMNVLFFRLLQAPTVPGRALLDKVEGFRMYLSTAEEERLKILHPPDKTPELFERYLPYAMALDCENEWNAKFAAVLAAAAAAGAAGMYWYHGSSWNTSSGGFSRNLGSALTSTVASATTAPGSSSGSGGGGSSGGGGGGGGGGGW